MAYQNYDLGEWRTAQHFFCRALDLLGFEDGPSAALLRFMVEPYQFEAPDWWKGMHALEEIPARPHDQEWASRRWGSGVAGAKTFGCASLGLALYDGSRSSESQQVELSYASPGRVSLPRERQVLLNPS